MEKCNFCKININEFWIYTEKWCDVEFDELDLNSLCLNSSAEFELPYIIYSSGSEIHSHIKLLNGVVDEIENTNLESLTYQQTEDLLDAIEPSSHIGLEVFKRIDKEINLYKLDLLGGDTRSALAEIVRMQKEGIILFDTLKNFLTQLHKNKKTEKIRENFAETQQISRSLKIELKHVQAESGFIYILSNSMMKDIFKVGFTARNPDERAKEVSREMGIPAEFIVEKYWRTVDPFIVEQRIHKDLKEYHKGGEFFEGDYKNIIEIISRIIQVNNIC